MSHTNRWAGARPSGGPAVSTIFFDLDGVLVDTHDAEVRALEEYVREIGGKPVRRQNFELAVRGRRMSEAVDLVCELAEVTAPEGAVDRVRQVAGTLLGTIDYSTPFVHQALQSLPFSKYVVSNSPLDVIVDRLHHCGLDAYFPGPHFSAYELGVWKPAPDIYDSAVEALGLARHQVVVVEDSEAGLTAALDAGLFVFHYQQGAPAPTGGEPMNLRHLPNLAYLPSLVANL